MVRRATSAVLPAMGRSRSGLQDQVLLPQMAAGTQLKDAQIDQYNRVRRADYDRYMRLYGVGYDLPAYQQALNGLVAPAECLSQPLQLVRLGGLTMPVGTPFFDAFLARLQEWVDDLDLTPEMLTSWIYMAEERFNNELRFLEMVQTRGVMLCRSVCAVPGGLAGDDLGALRRQSSLPLRYVSSDEFWRMRSAAEFYLSGPQTTAITYLDPATGAPLGPLPRQPAFIDYPGP